jgi:hypothetical protein
MLQQQQQQQQNKMESSFPKLSLFVVELNRLQ